MRSSVKFLGHIISGDRVAVDPAKVEFISKISKADLMEDDGCTPAVKRIKSFLEMVFYYQHFIPNCSSVAKPLFALTAGQKRQEKLERAPVLVLTENSNPLIGQRTVMQPWVN